jgi:hypothetical protein
MDVHRKMDILSSAGNTKFTYINVARERVILWNVKRRIGTFKLGEEDVEG